MHARTHACMHKHTHAHTYTHTCVPAGTARVGCAYVDCNFNSPFGSGFPMWTYLVICEYHYYACTHTCLHAQAHTHAHTHIYTPVWGHYFSWHRACGLCVCGLQFNSPFGSAFPIWTYLVACIIFAIACMHTHSLPRGMCTICTCAHTRTYVHACTRTLTSFMRYRY